MCEANNPAKICRDRKWEEGTEIKRPNGTNVGLTIRIIGESEVVTESREGRHAVWEAKQYDTADFATFIKVGRYTLEVDKNSHYLNDYVIGDGSTTLNVSVPCHPNPGMTKAEADELYHNAMLAAVDYLNAHA